MIDNTNQETTARNYQYQLLLEVSQNLSATLEAAVDGLIRLSGLNTAAVYMLANQHLKLWATTPPLPPDFPDELRFTPLTEHPHIERTITSAKPQLIPDYSSENLTATERVICEERRLRTVLFVPLVVDDQVIGVFIVGSIAVPVVVSQEIVVLSTTLSHMAALSVKNAQLYHHDRTRVAELQQAQLALQQKNAELEQFVYSVSHDLKSPLITVKSFASMLREDLSGGDQRKMHKSLDYINMAADNMQQLLEGLLQYSQIDRSGVPFQTLSVNQLTNNCLNTLAGILRQKDVQVKTSKMPYKLHGNLLYLGRIWQNLTENAVKYMGDQAHPQIEIGASEQGHEVIFYVADNGIGVDPEHETRIFNMFSQLNPSSEGSGLGLALVKKIVTIYQGRIWVESAGKGKGSCFYFTLPDALIKQETATCR